MSIIRPNANRSLLIVALFVLIALPLPALAQHFEAGAFVGYSRLDLPNFPQNTVSLGGRMDFPFIHFVKLEVEGAYDFRIPQITFSSVGVTPIVTLNQVGGPRVNGGLKFQSHGGSYFFFLKGGADMLQPESVVRGLNGAVISSTSGNTIVKGTFYPGAGVSFFAGPIGLRFDGGDEIFWLNGDARNNWRLNFGPSFRF